MQSKPTPPDADRLLEEACAWLTRMHSGEFGPSDRQSLAEWRAAAHAHEQAWHRAERLWQGFEPLRERCDLPGSRPLSQEYLPSWQPHASPSMRRRRLRPSLAIASTVLLAMTLYTFPPIYWQADYLTEKGERRTLTLTDGSRVILNTASAVKIEYDDTTRRIRLLEGEAFFEVAKDASHPFAVTAYEGEVWAVGTAFSVQRRESRLSIELVEGVVDLIDRGHRHKERLRPGQVAQMGADSIQVQSSRTDSLALWHEGYLRFDGLPLDEAVAQINRYRPGRIVLLNHNLAGHRISGLFRLDSLDQAVDTLTAAVPGLQKSSLTSRFIFLR
ncbi:MAG: FecR family protein [Methylococcaceae bacterium]|nr:FecR family protein [Methylococcaceae bacterium]